MLRTASRAKSGQPRCAPRQPQHSVVQQGVPVTSVPDALTWTRCNALEILHGVWGESFYGDDNLLDVYIRYLRQKVESSESPS